MVSHLTKEYSLMNSINKLLYLGEICTNLNKITDIDRSKNIAYHS
jgi:hypothetical protein